MTDTQTLARNALAASGLTVSQLAASLDVTPDAVHKWTTGARTVSGPARILLTLWAHDPEHAAAVCALAVEGYRNVGVRATED